MFGSWSRTGASSAPVRRQRLFGARVRRQRRHSAPAVPLARVRRQAHFLLVFPYDPKYAELEPNDLAAGSSSAPTSFGSNRLEFGSIRLQPVHVAPVRLQLHSAPFDSISLWAPVCHSKYHSFALPRQQRNLLASKKAMPGTMAPFNRIRISHHDAHVTAARTYNKSFNTFKEQQILCTWRIGAQ